MINIDKFLDMLVDADKKYVSSLANCNRLYLGENTVKYFKEFNHGRRISNDTSKEVSKSTPIRIKA